MELFANIRSIVLDAIAFARKPMPVVSKNTNELKGASAIKCW